MMNSACTSSSLSIYYKWVLIHDDSDLTYETMPVILLSSVCPLELIPYLSLELTHPFAA